jgi:sugar O-acyltransferase (sialic acid O-acetyltransferase NeuD family)
MRILIVGTGGQGRVAADAARESGVDICGPVEARTAESIQEQAERHGCDHVHIAVGFNPAREQISGMAEAAGLPLAAIVHPSAIVASGVTIGEGCAVMAGAVIQVGSVLGRGVIVNSHASIDHDCLLDDYSAVSPGAILGGNVRIGARTWIGLGAALIHGRSVGSDSVVGAGAVVLRDIPSLVVAWGNPCREMRPRNPFDKYL